MKLSVNIPQSDSMAEGEPLSPMARLLCEPHFNCYIIYMLGFGNILTAREIKAGLKATLLLHPRFSSIIQVTNNSWRKKHRWVPTEANLDEHVVFPDPGEAAAAAAVDPTAGDLYVENYAADLCRSGLDPSRPLWDLHILNIRTSEAAGVAVFRIHHSLGDGTSLMSLLHACTRRTSDPESLPSLPQTRRRSTARSGPLMFLRRIWTSLTFAWNTLVDLFFFASAIFFLKDARTPFMEKEGVEYRPKRIAHRTLLLDDIKAITNTIGCVMSFTPLLQYETLMLSLVHANCLMKFHLINLVHANAILSYKFGVWIYKIMGIKVLAVLFNRILSNTTVCFSNIIGPIEEVSFCGSPLLYIAPTLYRIPQALTIHVQSYLNKVKIVLAVDKHAIPDPQKLLEDIEDSLQIIKNAATSKLKPE